MTWWREYWRDAVAGLTVLASVLMLAGGGGGASLLSMGGRDGPGGVPVQVGGAELSNESPDEPARSRSSESSLASRSGGHPEATSGAQQTAWETKEPPDVTSLSPDPGTAIPSTPVEQDPVSVGAISREDKERLLEKYRRYMNQGEIEIKLGSDRVTSSQMESVIELYILKRDRAKDILGVMPDGSNRRLDALPPGRLMGDLPRSRFPAALSKTELDWLGVRDESHAYYLLRLEHELQIYRLVASQQPKRGSEVRLELRPEAGRGIQVALVGMAGRQEPAR